MSRSCFVLQNAATSLAEFAQTALLPKRQALPITLEQLGAAQLVADAEMGALIVPYDLDADNTALEAELQRLRDGGVNLSVLALCQTTNVADAVQIGPIYDDAVAAEWSSASAKIQNFVNHHVRQRHDRAFRAFLDTSVDGYWIWDVESDVVEWSKRTCEMTGISPENSPNSIGTFAQIIHPQDVDRVHQAINNHFHHGSPYRDVHFRLLRGDGTYGDFLANGQALRNEKGAPIILVGSVTDRTILARMEQQLEDTQKRFTMLFHRMNDAAALADIETGIILEANEPAERLWGKSIAELVGSHQSNLHPPALSAEAIKAFQDHVVALKKNNRATIQVPALRKDGTLVPTEISSSLIEIGGKTMILGVFRDITERVKAEQEIRERDAQIQLSSHLASMGTLAAGVAHEINNPLTYVIGNLEYLSETVAAHHDCTPEVLDALSAASTGAAYLREIVTDLKSISRMDAAESRCNPADVIRIATRMAMSDLRHRARLELDLAKVEDVPISSARLSQVVLNILSNAAQSFPTADQSKNCIKVTVQRCDEGVSVIVKDNGSGIAPEDLSRVYDPFFTRNHNKGGTGLGLSICRRILTEVGGTLQLASEMGEGTTVTVFIPMIQTVQAEKPAPALDATPQARRARLMVIDDDVMVSKLIQQVVSKDFDAQVFNDPLAALQALRDGAEVDLVLCDLMMPDLDGGQLFEAAADVPNGRPPFLFITGGGVTKGSIEMEKKMSELGRLIFKPFKGSELRDKIKELLLDSPFNPVKIMQTDASIVADLEEMLGSEKLTAAYQHLLMDLDAAMATMAGLVVDGPSVDLAKAAHKVAGGAAILGLSELATCLRTLEKAPDMATLTAEFAKLPDFRRAVQDLITKRGA